MERIEKNENSKKNTLRTYELAKRNINTRYLSSDVIKYLNIFKSDKLINKQLVVNTFNSMKTLFNSKQDKELKSNDQRQSKKKVDHSSNKLLKIKGKLPVLKTGKMIKNEKMSLDKLLKNVKDNDDYDYLVKAISKWNKKKTTSKLEEEDTILKDKISFILDKHKDVKKRNFSKKTLMFSTKVRVSSDHLTGVSTLDTKPSYNMTNPKDSPFKSSFSNGHYISNLKCLKKNYILTRENISLEYQNNKKFLQTSESHSIYHPIKIYSSGLKVENEIKNAKKLLDKLKNIMNF